MPKPAHILLVEDDELSREVLGVLLEGEGYTVDSVDCGETALALLRDGLSPQLVLADLKMPGLTGAALADRMRQACQAAAARPVLLAMSASAPDPEDIVHFDGFLLKPFAARDVSTVFAAAVSPAREPPPKKKSARRKFGSAPDQGQLESLAASASATSTRRTRRSTQASNPGMNLVSEPPVPAPIPFETAPAGSVLDETIYRKLAAAMPARQLQQMYAMCLDDARERIATMRHLAADGADPVRFVREAHSIKGGCGMLGASELQSMAARLEARGLPAVAHETRDGVNPLDELSAACDRLERILGSRA